MTQHQVPAQSPGDPDPRYRLTIIGSFAAFVVQSIINNFLPLLFLMMRETYGLRLDQIAWLIAFNFVIQLIIDFAAMFFVDRIGYRASLVMAHLFAAGGLSLLAVLPGRMEDGFAAFAICILFYAIGGGLIEVIVSPLVDATPSKHKSSLMSISHSFYCWGHMAVVLFSTLFLALFGMARWPILALIWAVIPLLNMLLFLRAPIPEIPGTHVSGKIPRLLRSRWFWFFVLLMLAAGATEQAVSQWASSYAEAGLGVTKAVGDIAGPLLFAALMGTSRALYGKFGPKLKLNHVMLLSAGLGVVSFLLISLSPWAGLSFAGIGISGFAVGIMWPGTVSLAAERIPLGGTAMFAMLALAGDVGCALGPAVVGRVAGDSAAGLANGILAAMIFPLTLVVLLYLLNKRRRAGSLRPAS